MTRAKDRRDIPCGLFDNKKVVRHYAERTRLICTRTPAISIAGEGRDALIAPQSLLPCRIYRWRPDEGALVGADIIRPPSLVRHVGPDPTLPQCHSRAGFAIGPPMAR